MSNFLGSAGARQSLRREVWRRSRAYLLPTLLFAGLIAASMALGVFPFSTTRYDGVQTLDGTFRFGLFIIAFAIGLTVTRTASGLGPLLRRLPAAPVALLKAQLQIATALGAVVFTGFLLTEYGAAPAMMHPSFPERLNPAEVETLRRLPGVPLLQFTVDGKKTSGLTSELSVAAMRTSHAGRSSVGTVWHYGETHRWPHFPNDPPEPGDVLAVLAPDDWSSLQNFQRSMLHRLGIPTNAAVKIELERYVARDEYRSQPWRRDGLGRERQWHAFDRAAGFLGLLFLLTCAMSAPRQSIGAAMAPPMAIFALQWSMFGRLPFRPWLLSSDLAGDQPRIPTFGTQQTLLGNLIFPAAVVIACAAAYALRVWQVRSAPLAHQRKNERFVASVKRQWHSGSLARVKLIATMLFLAGCLGYAGLEILPNARDLRIMIWLFAAVGAIATVASMTRRWARLDALLGRLPMASSRVVRQRLFLACLGIVGISLVPLAIEQVWPIEGEVEIGRTLIQLGSPGWMKSLVIVASGSLFMVVSLLGHARLSSRLGAALCLFVVIMTLMTMNFSAPPWLAPVSLGLIATTLPLVHRLMQRRIELGRAPEISELLG